MSVHQPSIYAVRPPPLRPHLPRPHPHLPQPHTSPAAPQAQLRRGHRKVLSQVRIQHLPLVGRRPLPHPFPHCRQRVRERLVLPLVQRSRPARTQDVKEGLVSGARLARWGVMQVAEQRVLCSLTWQPEHAAPAHTFALRRLGSPRARARRHCGEGGRRRNQRSAAQRASGRTGVLCCAPRVAGCSAQPIMQRGQGQLEHVAYRGGFEKRQ